MSNPEDTGIIFEFEDNAALLHSIQKGLTGQIGSIALQKPVSEATLGVIEAGDHFDLEAKVKLAPSFFEPLGEQRRTEAAKLLKDYMDEHATGAPGRHADDISGLVENIDELYEGQSGTLDTDLEKDFLTNSEALSDVQERGGIYTFQTTSGRRLAMRHIGYQGITLHTGSAVRDPLDAFLGDSEPQRVIAGQPKTNEEDFKAYFDDVTSTLHALISFLYRKHGMAVPNDVMKLRSVPKPGIREQHMMELAQEPDESVTGLEIENPNVPLSSIGGIADAKREIEGLAFALKNPELYKKWGTKLPKGILLYGLPGTGKTLLAKALASESDARFLNVNLSDIASKWYGESEQKITEIFEYAAKQDDNTVIFFDEIDAIAPDRDRVNGHEATNRTLSILLTKIDGIASSDNVLVVGTTNVHDKIDSALLSRFSREVEVPLPDEDGRKQILELHFTQADTLADQKIIDDIDYVKLAAKTKGMSGRRLQQIVQLTLEEKIRLEGTGHTPGPVTTEDVLKVLQIMKAQEKTKSSLGFN